MSYTDNKPMDYQISAFIVDNDVPEDKIPLICTQIQNFFKTQQLTSLNTVDKSYTQ